MQLPVETIDVDTIISDNMSISEAESLLSNYATFSKISKLVYPSVFNHKNYGFLHQRMIHDRWKRAFCRVLWNDRDLVIVFRGTRDPIDWAINLDIRKRYGWISSNRKAAVHNGFSKALEQHSYKTNMRVIDQIQDIISKEGIGRSIFLTGHSLGGALATLCGSYINNKYSGLINSIITFGAPAVGDISFKELYSIKKTYRFYNGIDVVGFLPGPYYHHVGNEYTFLSGKLFVNTNWLSRLMLNLRRINLKLFSNHSIASMTRVKFVFASDEIRTSLDSLQLSRTELHQELKKVGVVS